MIFIHVNSNQGNIEQFNEYMKKGKPIFVLFYMEGCGPCNATRPEWAKIENVLKDKYKNKDIVIADIDQELLGKIPDLKTQPAGFPSMKYIQGEETEDYEDSTVENKDRTVDSFVEWIDTKIAQKGGSKKSHRYKTRKTKKTRKIQKTNKKHGKIGGKWSLKYKRSINCNKPKGFSQRQHCKYGRKKMHGLL
jgi:thiol-disulfide isomerase/thioredoxin